MTTNNKHIATAVYAMAQLAEALVGTKPPTQFKSLKELAQDLRQHAYNYALDDGQLCADLHAAANYLEALS